MKEYKFKINGNAYDVVVESVENGIAKVLVNGKSYNVEVEEGQAVCASAPVSAPVQPAPVAQSPVAQSPVVSTPASVSTAGVDVVSPLPGVIIGINVNVGDKVSVGQSVAVLEAMKMENAIESEKAGTVTAIHVQKGDSVLEGAKIVTIA